MTAHSGVLDWDNGARRHLARITPQAERPTETPFLDSTEGDESVELTSVHLDQSEETHGDIVSIIG